MCWRTAFPANVVLLCALVLCMGASSATAQEADSQPEPRTRQEMLQRERAAKVERAASYAPGFLERWLVKVEKDPTPEDLFRASDGFYLQAGGITTGAGLALGPAYKASGMFGDRLDFMARASASLRGYWIGEVELSMPRLAGGWMFASIRGRKSEYPEEDFFGLGTDSLQANRVNFTHRNTAVGGMVGVHLGPRISIGAELEGFAPRIGRGQDSLFPSIEEVFTEDTAPGLSAQPNFLRYAAFADVNYAEPIENPRSGGHYRVSYNYYNDLETSRFRFSRLDIDLL